MKLSAEVERMLRERPAGQIWLSLVETKPAGDFDELARTAGLAPLGHAWVEIDGDRAREFLVSLLHRDLAYNSEVMPHHWAEWLAGEFLDSFGRFSSRFATNSRDLPGELPFSWEPATDHTFDAGVAIIGEAGSGIFWVADED